MHDRTLTFRGDWLAEIEQPRPKQAPAFKADHRYRDRLVTIAFLLVTMTAGLAIAGWLSPTASPSHDQVIGHMRSHDVAEKAPVRPETSDPSQDDAAEVGYQQAHTLALDDGIPTPMFDYYYRFGHQFALPWQLLAAIGTNETGNGTSTAPGVHSDTGYSGCCGGVMELCFVSSCGNAAEHYGIDGDGDGVFDIFDDADSVATAANILASFKQIWGSDMTLLMAAYNAGPAAIKEYHGVPPYTETENYVIKGAQTLQRLGYVGEN